MSWKSILQPFGPPPDGLTHKTKQISERPGHLCKTDKNAMRTLRRNLFLSVAGPVLREALTNKRGTPLLSRGINLTSRELPRTDSIFGECSEKTRSLRRTARKFPSKRMVGYRAKECLPLARRLFKTKRPLFVFILVKKPCVFARRRLLG